MQLSSANGCDREESSILFPVFPEVQEAGGLHHSKAIQVNISARMVKCHKDNGLRHHLQLLLLGYALWKA